MSALVESLELKGAQLPAALTRGADVLVTAGAGSGKTKTLVARYVTLLDEETLPQQVVAITFTEKAAREMRNRIRKAIQQWRNEGCLAGDRERWGDIEADIDAARIGTIHSLCASLLRAHPAEARIDPRTAVLEEGLATVLKAQAVEDTLVWAIGQAELQPLFEIFEIAELQDILGRLLANRLAAPAAMASAVPERWRAAILQALAGFVEDAEVADAIAEMRKLRDCGQLEADAGDKLAPQTRGLLAQWGVLEQALDVGDHVGAAQALFIARRDYGALNTGYKTSQAKAGLAALIAKYRADIEPWLGKTGEPPDPEVERRAADGVSLLGKLFEQAAKVYRESKELRQALDFDDLEDGAQRLLENPEVRARWQGQIAYVLVDEFQDTNGRQRAIVESLAGIPEGIRGRLFVVGDAKQSIYRFRGADVAVFRDLEDDIKARGGETLALDVTFRAHEPLVAALNEILGNAMGVGHDRVLDYEVPFAPLTAYRGGPRKGITEPHVEFLYGLGENAAAARPIAARVLAQCLIELREQQGVKWDDVALLFRAASGFPDYEAALEAAGIPFVTVAGKGFYDRPEVRDILNVLRALADPWDDLSMAGLLRSPAFGLSDAGLYHLRWPARPGTNSSEPESLHRALREELSELSEGDRQKAERAREIVDELTSLVDRITVAELIKELLDRTFYRAILASAGAGLRLQRNVDKLLADASASGLVRVSEFLEYVESLREGGAREGEAPAEAGGAVRLMTVHKAKGLQFPVVVIADASHARPNSRGAALFSSDYGLVPCPDSVERKPLIYGLAKVLDDGQTAAEDLRVLYVAATRAEEKLIICGSQSRSQGGSWLAILAEASGLNLAELASKPGELQEIVLPQSRQRISALSQGAPEDNAQARVWTPEANQGPASNLKSLLAPVASQRISETAAEAEVPTFQIRRVTAHARHEGTVLGTMVHEALRRWRFPCDPALDEALGRLLRTAALSAGLVDPDDIDHHIHEASLLLTRLRNDTHWPELNGAQRWHEVPYTVLRDGLPSTGIIDLLYRSDEPAAPDASDALKWCVVDFKTNDVAREADLDALVSAYTPQMLAYGHAVAQLLGNRSGRLVQTTLCFLDYRGGVRWIEV